MDVLPLSYHHGDPVPAAGLNVWKETLEAHDHRVTEIRASRLRDRIYVIESQSPQRDPVPTGTDARAHQVLLCDAGPSRVTERDRAGRITFDIDYVPGDLLISSPETLLENHLTTWDRPARLLNVFLEPSTVSAACRAAGLDYDRVEFLDRTPAQDPLLAQLVRALVADAEDDVPGERLYAETLMQALAVHLLRHHCSHRHAVEKPRGGLPPVRLRRVRAYVEAHLDQEITLETLAAEAGYNPYHFARLFKRSTGQSPYDFVIARRLERAKRLLQEGEQTILQVSLAVGYESQGHFTSLFKRRVGTTPSRYRKQWR